MYPGRTFHRERDTGGGISLQNCFYHFVRFVQIKTDQVKKQGGYLWVTEGGFHRVVSDRLTYPRAPMMRCREAMLN